MVWNCNFNWSMTHDVAAIFFYYNYVPFRGCFLFLLREGELYMEICLSMVIGLVGRLNVDHISHLFLLLSFVWSISLLLLTWFSSGPERELDKAVDRTLCQGVQLKCLWLLRDRPGCFILFFEGRRGGRVRKTLDRLRISLNCFTSDGN